MALLVRERKALEALESALELFYEKVLGNPICVNREVSVEERLLFVKAHITMVS